MKTTVKNKFIIFSCLLIVFVLTACISNKIQGENETSSSRGVIITNDIMDITYVNLNEIVEIKKAKTFKILLSSNPTTGYRWQIKTINREIVEPVTNMFIPPSKAPNLVGRGGHELWLFKALECGETLIHMVYVRSWESNTPPAREEIFRIKVIP